MDGSVDGTPNSGCLNAILGVHYRNESAQKRAENTCINRTTRNRRTLYKVNMKIHHIDLPDARSILQPRMTDFAAALKLAIHRWNSDLSAYHVTLSEFTRCNIISDLWYETSQKALTNDGGVRLIGNRERRCFIVDDAVVLRFKHLDSNYRPRNNTNRRSDAWNCQTNFRDIPPVVRLDFGYRMDLTGTVVETAFVMLNNGARARWRWQIWGRPISRFAGTPTNMYGDTVYVHYDYSKVV